MLKLRPKHSKQQSNALAKVTRPINVRGFTIIEVLIALATAGLIMVIVFLAIAKLQRNSRNTQRKKDVAYIVYALNAYTIEKRISSPSFFLWPGPGNGGPCWFTSGDCPEARDFFFNDVQKIMSYYDLPNTLFYATDFAPFSGPGTRRGNYATVDSLWMTSSSACDPNQAPPGPGGIISVANIRSMAIAYRLEGGPTNGETRQCITVTY